MADIIKRVWRSGPRKVKRVAWGYTLQVDGKQVRKYDSAWTEDDAQKALAAAVLERGVAKAPASVSITFGQASERFLATKARKRSIAEDTRVLQHLVTWFGQETPLGEITAGRISEYKAARMVAKSRQTGELLSAASINRSLALLRHLLRLACQEWEVIGSVPRIRLEREPEGRVRFLAEDEMVRLLAACRKSRSPYLATIVTIALNTGMRKSEILGLAWERVDFSRGVLLLDRTKSGRRREIPMNDSVYSVLSALPGPKAEGLLFRKASGVAWGEIRTAFDRACRDAKVPGFRFHDTRHSFASWLVMRGRHLKEVQELLGHASVRMTERYSHLSPDRLREAVAALEGLGRPVDKSGAETTAKAPGSAQRQHMA